ncbi:MAG: bifunctional diaminohydroxyphosphoribosylaminopyrimidine deaminase/5-amino-6-(5-phosphoribosylamino)uracil reductase RibD [Magnetococcales bacterium]|nr:bifunctional diaminohydroxyphosphoribosylaminopyrimidine deaminase/5-amino-6-(5-phosphoribosylamino)uracil reductase RibD [Magnetococcales bacterium]
MSKSQDRNRMKRALRLAARAAGRTRPNPMVGCVIVQGDQVIGQGFHPKAGEPHAEVFALREAGDAARGATAYVTLEPCSHQGRTPPCADALVAAGVSRVVVAMVDPNPKVAGRGVARLREAGITVDVGLCESEAQALNQPFVTWVTWGRPMVTLKAATSLDGKIATRTGHSQWITGPAARQRVQRMRDTHDVVMVGSGTVKADDPRLNCRLSKGRDPIRLVVDSKLAIDDSAKLFHSGDAPLWIATTDQAPIARRRALELRDNVRILTCWQDSQGRVDLSDLMQRLGELEVTSVLSEAGGRLTASLLEDRLADRLALFMAPKLIGGQDAEGVLAGVGVNLLSECPTLCNMQTRMVGPDLLLEGSLCYPGAGDAI